MVNGELLIQRLEEKAGSVQGAAALVGVKPAAWCNWKGRKFPDDAQLRVWLALNAPRILQRWLKEREAA